jgi:hypothetical protein
VALGYKHMPWCEFFLAEVPFSSRSLGDLAFAAAAKADYLWHLPVSVSQEFPE